MVEVDFSHLHPFSVPPRNKQTYDVSADGDVLSSVQVDRWPLVDPQHLQSHRLEAGWSERHPGHNGETKKIPYDEHGRDSNRHSLCARESAKESNLSSTFSFAHEA